MTKTELVRYLRCPYVALGFDLDGQQLAVRGDDRVRHAADSQRPVAQQRQPVHGRVAD